MKRNVFLASLAVVSAAGSSGLADPCSALPNPVVVTGSTAIRPLIQKLGPLLALATGSDQLTVILAASGSCAGVAALATNMPLTGNANYYTTDALGALVTNTCALTDTGAHVAGTVADLALSDVFMQSCTGSDTSSLAQTQTVVIPFGFIVPTASSQNAIDTREAYLAYGFGNDSMVTPWNNEMFLFARDALSGTQITISRAIGVPENRFLGTPESGTGPMITAVAGATNTEAALGFASQDQSNAHRDTLRELAYRHTAQNQYYWSDSRHDSFDKLNIRDGHYPLWSYEQAVVRTSGGSPVSAAGQLLADIIAGTHAVTAINILDQTIAASLIPTCAMQVSRTVDGGDFSLYSPAHSCGCYFDAHVVHGSTTCTQCPATACAANQTCSNGYCENQ